MSTQLDALPIEMLAHVALFLDRNRQYRTLKRDNSLLALRSVSRACLDAARRAIRSHPRTNEMRFDSRSNAARIITTVGAVLGSGCQTLTYHGNTQATPPEVLNALRQFVVETRGRLLELSLSGSSMSAQLFLEICRACPQLKELSASWRLPNIASADVDDLATELSRSCPLLERVNIRTNNMHEPCSPAETYAMHFPNLKYLDMGADVGPSYEPSRFDKIEATARLCVGAEELSFNGCTVGAAFAERLIRTPLQSRIKSLYLNEATISQPTFLRLAAGLEALREIVFPDKFSASPEFFTSLARARPALKEFQFDEGSTLDDACVAAMCENLKLEALHIDDNNTLTHAVVDIIVRSPTAATLSFVSFSCTPGVNSAGILRLARGCPRLGEMYWHVQGMTPLGYDSLDGTLHGKNVDDLLALLKERSRGHPDWHFYVDPFKTFGPWKLSEKWRYAHYPNQDA